MICRCFLSIRFGSKGTTSCKIVLRAVQLRAQREPFLQSNQKMIYSDSSLTLDCLLMKIELDIMKTLLNLLNHALAIYRLTSY